MSECIKSPRATRVSGYVLGCRCDHCRAAAVAADKVKRAARLAKVAAGTMPVPHGTDNGYVNYGCHCADCRAAHAASTRARYHARKREAS